MWKSIARPASRHPMAWLGGLLIILATAACGAQQSTTEVIGSGVSASEQRTTGTFTSLSITAKAVDAYVEIGSPAAVKVTSDDNIVPLITTAVSNGELTVALNRDVSTNLGMRVDITAPELTSVHAGQAVKVHMTDMAGEQLAMRGDVGSQLAASGQVTHMSLTLVGGARADLQSLKARDVVVSLAGASTAEVLATNSVSGQAHEVSHLGVWGDSPSVNVDASEGSTVTMMGAPMMP